MAGETFGFEFRDVEVQGEIAKIEVEEAELPRQ